MVDNLREDVEYGSPLEYPSEEDCRREMELDMTYPYGWDIRAGPKGVRIVARRDDE